MRFSSILSSSPLRSSVAERIGPIEHLGFVTAPRRMMDIERRRHIEVGPDATPKSQRSTQKRARSRRKHAIQPETALRYCCLRRKRIGPIHWYAGDNTAGIATGRLVQRRIERNEAEGSATR